MNENKVCIVSLIGKTQLLPNQSKAWKLNSLINTNYFKPLLLHKKNLDIDKQQYQAFGIDTYHDTKNKVIYIHLESIYDTNNALEILFENSESKTFFEIWENEHIKYLRSILLLFSISHIVIISSPSCEFDIGYIRFFRIIETLRNKMLPQLVDLIKSLNLPIGKDWLYAGRPCSPRVLFTFENCPADLFGGVEGLNENSKQAKMIEKLQHSLEDQIYNSLRKSYVITNISNNSLFSIPANQEFAYIHRLSVQNSVDTNRFLLSNLFMECSRAKEVAANSTNFLSHLRQQHHQQSSTLNQQNYLSNQIINNEGSDAKLFRKFVFEHVKTALNEGFNDNIGRTNVQPVFELPTVNCFDKLFDALCDFFLNEPKSSKIKQQYAQIKSHVDTESQFSENRCKKVLPTALSLYQENLPGHFTKSQHQQRV
jgi:protein SMG8